MKGWLLALALAGCGKPAPCPGGAGCAGPGWTLPAVAIGSPGARHPSLALDGAGKILAAWELDGIHSGVEIAEEDGGELHVRSPSKLDGPASGVQAAADEDGTAVVTWAQGPAGTGRVFAATRRGGVWSDPSGPGDALSFAPTAYEPQAAGTGGEWLLVWNQFDGEHYGVALARSEGEGAGWVLPAGAADALSPPIFFSNAPRVALRPGGQALVVWYQSTGGPLRVYASERRSAGGPFRHPEPDDALSSAQTTVDSHPIGNPWPALSADGRAAVVWTADDGRGAHPVYLARRDAAGTWTRPPDPGDTLSAPTGTAACAQAAFDPSGALHVVWFQDSVVFHARVHGAGAVEGPTPLSSGAPAFNPALAVGPSGQILVAYLQEESGHDRVMVRRADAGGTWSAPEPLSDGDQDAADPAAAIGAGGREVVVFAQGQGDLARVRAARRE